MPRISGSSRASLRRHAGAGLATASLLSLLLSQPFHAPRPIEGDGVPRIAAAAAAPTGAPAAPTAHDADRCPQCRAFAKTRLGLRPPGAVALAADQPLLSLHWPPPAPPTATAELRHTPPRAPPTA